MPLFRVSYPRDGKMETMTVCKSCSAMAMLFVVEHLQDYIASIGGGWVATVKPVASRIDQPALFSRRQRGSS